MCYFAPMEIKWTDVDPESGRRRYVFAERFAREWSFKWKLERRGEWRHGLTATREMWEILLDVLRRRYRRRQGVTDEDVIQVERILKVMPLPRELDAESDPEAPLPRVGGEGLG